MLEILYFILCYEIGLACKTRAFLTIKASLIVVTQNNVFPRVRNANGENIPKCLSAAIGIKSYNDFHLVRSCPFQWLVCRWSLTFEKGQCHDRWFPRVHVSRGGDLWTMGFLNYNFGIRFEPFTGMQVKWIFLSAHAKYFLGIKKDIFVKSIVIIQNLIDRKKRLISPLILHSKSYIQRIHVVRNNLLIIN